MTFYGKNSFYIDLVLYLYCHGRKYAGPIFRILEVSAGTGAKMGESLQPLRCLLRCAGRRSLSKPAERPGRTISLPYLRDKVRLAADKRGAALSVRAYTGYPERLLAGAESVPVYPVREFVRENHEKFSLHIDIVRLSRYKL